MCKIAVRFRYVLRWLALGAAGAALGLALFAASLPFLADGQMLRDAFIRNLSAWAGGPVNVHGEFRIVSFTSLSIEANDVDFKETRRLSPIATIRAKSITAILRLRPLLRGRIEFKKIIVESPRFVLDRHSPVPKRHIFGIETARAALAFAGLNRFEQFELRDCVFFSAEDARRPYSRNGVALLRLDREERASFKPGKSGPLLRMLARGAGFEAYFRGSMDRARETGSGSIRLRASSAHPAAARIADSIAPWERGQSVSLAGDLTWTGARAALDNATIAFGDRNAKGSLAFAPRRGRPVLEGTLAYDRLEWDRREAGSEKGEPSQLLQELGAAARSGRDGQPDLDMRISAERFRAPPYEMGPLALALTSYPGRLTIDIAELTIFGGKVTGRLDFNAVRPDTVSLNATASRLDALALTRALGWPFDVTGAATVRFALEIPFKSDGLAKLEEAKGNFGINFPGGGTLEGGAFRPLIAAVTRRELFWGLGSNSFPFNTASIEGATEPGGITLKIDAESAGSLIGGSLRIGSPGNTVSGTLSVEKIQDATDAPPGAVPPPPPANIVLSGTLDEMNFSPLEKPNLSN